MDKIQQARSISIWIFLIPFISVNTCLILITEFQWLFPNQEDIIHNTFPYFDGEVSISRTARYFPAYLIFKPAMIITSFLLIRYWLFNREIIKKMGFAVYLTASIKELVYRTEHDKNRPLINSDDAENKIRNIINDRKEYYESTSNMTISTDNYDTVKISKIIIKNYEKYKKNNS